MKYRIIRKKEEDSNKIDVIISAKQIKEMYSEIKDDTVGFIVWLEQIESITPQQVKGSLCQRDL